MGDRADIKFQTLLMKDTGSLDVLAIFEVVLDVEYYYNNQMGNLPWRNWYLDEKHGVSTSISSPFSWDLKKVLATSTISHEIGA